MTSFPSLTGRRIDAVSGSGRNSHTLKCLQSQYSISDLQEAARRHNASITAIPQFVWAKLLGIYTGTTDELVFDCVLPKHRDVDDTSLSSAVVYASAEQLQGQSSLGHIVRQFSENTTRTRRQDVTCLDGAEEHRQPEGSLLDLEHLLESPRACSVPGDDSHFSSNFAEALRLGVSQSACGLLLLTVSGQSSLIDDNAALLLLAQYEDILETIIPYPDLSVDKISTQLPSPLLSISNPYPMVASAVSSLQTQFEITAKSDPQQVALEYWSEQPSKSLQLDVRWTYALLNQKAETFAVELRSRFGPLVGHIVPICMGRCPEIYIAILGILKAGAAWCPIDPSFPPLRRHDLIARTGAQALVVDAQSPRDGIPDNVTTIALADIDWSSSKNSEGVSVHPESLAYLIWTSGTTGAPKGVPISHRAAATSMRALQACIPTDTKQGKVRCLQFSQFTFDVFVQDLFYTWGVGGTLIAADRATMLGSFSNLATKTRATHAHLTPAFAASVPRSSCPSLEVVTMIGEKLTSTVADDWSYGCRLYNTYGPAEATVVAMLRLVPHEDNMQSANIGIPLPSVSAFVIQHGELVMRNFIGELALGGPQLSKGYWKDPTKTREHFVWNERLQTTLYMTGDIVRQLPDDTFEFIGRTDDLIKIQGIRVELSEIAFALRSCHPQAQQAEVWYLNRADRPSKVIVAFLAAPGLAAGNHGIIEDDQGADMARKALEVARTQLPEYMVPKVFLVVSAIPRTSSAKVDRAAMKQLYADLDIGIWEKKLGSRGRDSDSPADMDHPRETMIIEIISELTGTLKETMSRQSTLPSIGVDSITATRLATKFNDQHIAFSVADILQCSNLEDLLLYPRKRQAGTALKTFDLSAFHCGVIGSMNPEQADSVELVMPVMALQESLLSESFQNPNSYWSNDVFELNDGIDVTRLEKAWRHVAQHTDALRTSFYPVANLSRKLNIDCTFLQLIHKDPAIDWKTVSCPESQFETRARDRAREIAKQHQERRFMGPLWTVTVFTLESRNVMMFSIHHAIRDEPSLPIIIADLEVAYSYNLARPLQQRRQLRDAVSLLYTADVDKVQQDEQFWSNSLASYNDQDASKLWPELKLVDGGRSEGTITYAWWPQGSYNDIRARAINIGAASLAAVLRVVWGYILLEYLETDQVVFGETWSARSEALELSDIVAPLVFVIPVPFQARKSWLETLQVTTDFHQRSKAHYGVHPSSIRRMLHRSEGETLYPAIFNFVPTSAEQRPNGVSSLWREMDDLIGLSVEHAIAFNAVVTNDDTLRFELTALKQGNDMEHLRVLAGQVDAFLRIILENPDGQRTQLSDQMPQNLLSVTLLEDISATNLARTQSPTKWVDHNAAIHPNWIAAEVVSSLDVKDVISQTWSYQQLQQAYSNVATRIRESGLENRMIAVCLDRRLEVYAVILGIMSTGNTYLPIADDLPEERKLFLLQDSDAAMLFTTRSLASTCSPTCRTVLVEDVDYSKATYMPPETPSLPTDNAYLLYTSGSTGAPKGVLVSRGNLMTFIGAISHFIGSHSDLMSLQGKGKWLGMASFAFDVHLLEIFFAWRHGMAAVTAPRSMLLDNLGLALQKLQVTHASFVPSLVDNEGLDPACLPELRYMSLGGEKISKKAIDTWSRSHVVLANAYGPTEATIGCCFRRVEPTSNVRNIGYPLSYTVAHVLRPGTTDYVLRGTSGELCLTGDLIATGYHKRPEAKGFVEDFHGKKMYRTGDKVRLMADGSFEFLGREDDQTKIRGQRIELGEVSEAVRSGVAKILEVALVDVASLVLQHQALSRPQLVAFIATQKSSRNTTDDASTVIHFPRPGVAEKIRAHCRSTLPSFMVPNHLIQLSSLPLVPTSRKVDMKQLRAIFDKVSLNDLMSSNNLVSSSAKALSEAEIRVRNEVAEVLVVEQARLDADSNLFQVGLDSLNVINLTIKLQRQGFDCSVSQILKSPTIRGIARRRNHTTQVGEKAHGSSYIADLEGRFRNGDSNNGVDLTNVAVVRPCLPLQETLVASSLDREGEALYVNHVILELSPDVDPQRLIQAWVKTAEDHEILRTCFREFENHFIQIVLKDSPLSYDFFRIDGADDRLPYLRRRQLNIANDIIANIETQPPIRLTLATPQLPKQKGSLLVSLHHALYDAESFSMLLDEVYARYQGGTSPASHISITALIDHIESQSQSDARAFWTRYLAGYRPSSSFDSAANNQSRSTSREMVTPLTEIDRLAASMNGTSASVMQALFGIVLAETLGTDDVAFGSILSGRTVPVENVQSILAPCITTIPQRVRIDQSSILQGIISSAQQGFVESIQYQHTALRDIHRWVEAGKPLFDSLFTYTRKRGEASWSHLWNEVESSMSGGFSLAVEVVADHVTDRITIRCDFTAAFGTLEKAISIAERLESLVHSLFHGEEVTLEKLSIEKIEVGSSPNVHGNHWNKDETLMREIVSGVVGFDSKNISKDTSFFALGIDSIIAIQFAKRLRQHGVQCSSADVMRYPSIAGLSKYIASKKTSTRIPDRPADRRRALSGPPLGLGAEIIERYPCTPLQSSMLTQTLGSDTSLYVHHHAVRFSREDNAAKIKKAWEDVVARTEILRTGFDFSEEENDWSGVVYKQPYTIWNEHPSNVSLKRAMLIIKEAIIFQEVNDFERPPWRVDIVGDVFILSLHHSLYDEESIRLLFRDFWAFSRGAPLPGRPSFSRAAKEIYQRMDEADGYWVRSLEEFIGVPRSSTLHEFREARATLEINLADVLEGCRRLGVTLQSVALLAFGKTLASLINRRDVVFGHVVRGRTLPTVEAGDIIGPLFNTVPLRVNLEMLSTTNKDAAQMVQRLTGESQAYQHASLNKVQQAWREQNGNPDWELFDSLFVFQRRVAAKEDPSWECVAVGDDVAPTEYLTNFECEQNDAEINVCVNSRSFKDLDVFIRTFERLLCDLLHCPDRPATGVLDDLPAFNITESDHSNGHEPPDQSELNPTADRLATIRKLLAKVSGIAVEKIADNANIFSLGLDSISAIQIAAIARKEGLKLSVADVLQGRTVRGICQRLKQTQNETINAHDQMKGTVTDLGHGLAQIPNTPSIPSDHKSEVLALAGLRDDDVQDILPCLAGQYHHLSTWLKSGRTLCEGTFAYSCTSSLNLDKLLNAWRGLKERHPILRTVFVSTTQTEVMQVVLKPTALRSDAFQCIDYSPVTGYSIAEVVKQIACRRFDLFSPPIELILAQCTGIHDTVVLKLHHALYDAWTIGKIVEELGAFYEGRYLLSIPNTTSLILDKSRSPTLESSQNYWRKSLQDCHETIVSRKSQFPQPPGRPRRDFFFAKRFIPDLRQLEGKCQQSSISLPSAILVAYARTLALLTAVSNPTFGLYQTGRSSHIEGLAESCLPCLNVTPLMAREALTRGIQNQIEDLQSDLAARVPFEQSNLHDVLTWIGRGRKPLFNTFVNILWDSKTTDPQAEISPHPLLLPWKAPGMENLAPSQRLPGRTGVDALNTGFLADGNLFLDVQRCASEDELQLVARCDNEVLSEKEAEEFLGRIGDEIRVCVDLGNEESVRRATVE